jgi:hypothetical protein
MESLFSNNQNFESTLVNMDTVFNKNNEKQKGSHPPNMETK